jgi:hypothetical protein
MNNDSKMPIIAHVDVRKVRLIKPESLGIDFTNEIDIWAKMQFRYRIQIKHEGKGQKIAGTDILNGPHSLIYGVREKKWLNGLILTVVK